MIFSLCLFFILINFTLCSSANTSKATKINLNCDVRPFNDLTLLNYFLKQQLKQNPIQNDDLTKKFYEFRDTVDLNQLEADCDRKSKAKFALIKQKSKNRYEFDSASNKRLQKNRKEISQRMSLELGKYFYTWKCCCAFFNRSVFSD